MGLNKKQWEKTLREKMKVFIKIKKINNEVIILSSFSSISTANNNILDVHKFKIEYCGYFPVPYLLSLQKSQTHKQGKTFILSFFLLGKTRYKLYNILVLYLSTISLLLAKIIREQQ